MWCFKWDTTQELKTKVDDVIKHSLDILSHQNLLQKLMFAY